jgi:lipopolysaccharide export system protein LptA
LSLLALQCLTKHYLSVLFADFGALFGIGTAELRSDILKGAPNISMRRYSVLLSCAAILLALLITYTYVRKSVRASQHPQRPIVRVEPGVKATGKTWRYGKDDPQTNCPVVRATASSYRAVHDPSTFELTDMHLKLFNKGCSSYTYVETPKADFDEYSGVMTSKGDVLILMSVPHDKEPEDKLATANLVHVRTSGVRYETKTGKVQTDQPASFIFADGKGQGVGADYDPNTHRLHIRSNVSLDWTGRGPAEDALHVDAGELSYEEDHGKVFLWPWSRLKRHNTVVNAANSEVRLDQGVLQQVVAQHATGTDDEENRHVEYGADQLVALFNDNGDMTEITAEPNAHLLSQSASSKTSVTANKAVLHFDIKTDIVNGQERNSSLLHEAFADGNAVVDSSPVPRPDVKPSDTRILRSQKIEILMKQGGREIESLRTDSPGQLEIKPNQPDRSHRWLDGELIRVVYGDENSVDSFYAAKASTRTEKPLAPGKKIGKDGKPAPAPPPALTWSDELWAKFTPKSNDLATLEQKGNFRYEEGLRHATADRAFLEQAVNKIDLTGDARVWDDTGTTSAAEILLNQQTGDMDATGNVASTRQPDQQKKDDQNSPLLDQNRPLQARADKMETQDHNRKVQYDGHAILWQGANRLQADAVDIDRGAKTLHASGHVISQLVDHQPDEDSNQPPAPNAVAQNVPVRLEQVSETAGIAPTAQPPEEKKQGPVIYTLVHAPEMFYQDDERLAHYTGGVNLAHDKTTVKSNELRAFLTKDNTDKDGKSDSGTSLDHAFADGSVKVTQAGAARSRTGLAQHCEYFPKENKVVLNGGAPKMLDSRKGTTVGDQLTYWSDSDHVLVEGAPKKPVVSDMNRHR